MHQRIPKPCFFLIISVILSGNIFSQTTDDHYLVLKKNGVSPLDFVDKKLEIYDLLIFDDALHLALEPFQFYEKMLTRHSSSIDYVFLELFATNHQPDIDRYLNNPVKDSTILIPVFQNDYTGFGLRYKTYLDLLSTIWDINHDQNPDNDLSVIGVNQPIYWQGINSRQDYDLFQKSLTGRDYFMYKIIYDKLDGFKSSKKGVFLTNTRHAYKSINRSDGTPYWNSGTFFYKWHPNKSYSIRIHNATLNITSASTENNSKSTEGLDRYKYSWIKMENGLWDEAFELNDNKQVAISLEKNVFGNTAYVGNHMLNVKDGQTMYDAYDALIFLGPLQELHFSAKLDFLYTHAFKQELKRRIKILSENNLTEYLNQQGVSTVNELINRVSKSQPIAKSTLIK